MEYAGMRDELNEAFKQLESVSRITESGEDDE